MTRTRNRTRAMRDSRRNCDISLVRVRYCKILLMHRMLSQPGSLEIGTLTSRNNAFRNVLHCWRGSRDNMIVHSFGKRVQQYHAASVSAEERYSCERNSHDME